MKNHFLIILATIFVIGCDGGSKFEENFNQLNVKELNLYNQQDVELSDTVVLERVPSSYVGKLSLVADTLCFLDEQFCRKYNFGKDGKFIDYNFNKGRSNKEIDSEMITGYVSLNTDNHCIVSSTRYFLYDNSYNKYKSGVLNAVSDRTFDPTNPMIYTLSYENFELKSHNNYIYYNVVLALPDFNFIDQTTEFYNQTRTLFVYDLNSDKIIAMLGKYPESYKSGDSNLFSLINFDVLDSGAIYLSFEANKNIYIYDAAFTPTVCFGIEGKDMDVSYPKLSTIEDFRVSHQSNRAKYSHYKDITYIESIGSIARVYSKGSPDKDGLQIYNKDYNLVADLKVPKGSKIAGSDSEYLYLYNINELLEEIVVLKIRLKQ